MFKVKLSEVEEEKEQLRNQFHDLLESKDCRIAELEKDLFNEERENSVGGMLVLNARLMVCLNFI